MSSNVSKPSDTTHSVRSWFAKLPRRAIWITLILVIAIIAVGVFAIIKAQQAKTAATTQQAPLQPHRLLRGPRVGPGNTNGR